MDFNAYFNSVLKNGFSFLDLNLPTSTENDITKRYISNSENIVIKHAFSEQSGTDEHYIITGDNGGSVTLHNVARISTEFQGTAPSHINLTNVSSADIYTNAGSDIVEIQQKMPSIHPVSHTINAGDGNNFISLTTSYPNYSTIKITTGFGNDRILSTGYSNDIILSGAGQDMIMAGRGHDFVDAQDGWDSIIFDGNFNDYTIHWTENQSTTITDAEGNSVETVNVEELIFADQTFILPYQQLVQLDEFDQLYNYFSTYYATTNDEESNLPTWQSYDISSVSSQSSQSFTIADWSTADLYADNISTEIECYDNQFDFSIYEEIDHFAFEGRPDSQLHDFIRDHLPFDPRDALTQMFEHAQAGQRFLGSEQNDQILGTYGNDRLFGGDGHDFMAGGKGNDLFIGDKGNDIMLGGEGIDTAFFLGMSSDFQFDFEHGTMTDKNGEHGIDFLKSIERLIFLDAVYKITTDNQVELVDQNPFKLLESVDTPHLEIIGLPPRPPIPNNLEQTLPHPTAAEIEANLMRAYESMSQPDDHLAKPPGVDI